jgi:protein O-mannosyl-transferase
MADRPGESSRCRILGAAALLAMTLVVYLPVMHSGGFIWDDPEHIVKNYTLRDLSGLLAIWIHPTSIPQYYPIVHTTFWIEYHLWGLWPTGYHIDNVLLHGLAAILLWGVLRRLQISGAWLAAAIFAVHPVNVESVAWITERKNVLSAVFYFLSLAAYLNFTGDQRRAERFAAKPYFLSLVFFLCALLSKSVTCSLPAAILLLIYWRQGCVRWSDVKPLIPFFVIGLGMAIVTAALEKNHVGAEGREWGWSLGDRFLIAGRAVWFYAGKLVWPHPLTFVYPMWQRMHFSQQPGLIAYPIGVMVVVGILWILRNRIGRGPLVAVLFFIGTLLPALGFVNLYPMRYTLVADHYQYLAAIGLLVLFANILNRSLVTRGLAGLILMVLAALSWRQQAIYRNAIVLWQDTLQKNPTSWMAMGNLGDEYADLSDRADLPMDQRRVYRRMAHDQYEALLNLAPDQPVAHFKWGIDKELAGDLETARAEFATALELEPRFVPAMNSMGLVLMAMHRPTEAIPYYQQAIALDPGYAEAHYNYGVLLEASGDWDGAIEQYSAAVARNPLYTSAQYALANQLLFRRERADLALPHYAAAVDQQPDNGDYHFHYALALHEVGQTDEARAQCRIALQINPHDAQAQQLWNLMGGN